MTGAEEWLRIESLSISRRKVSRAQRRRQGRLRRGCAAGRARAGPGLAQEEPVGAGADQRPGARERAAGAAGLPALRPPRGGLRRLQDAAPARRRAGRGEAARARGQPLAPGEGAARAPAAADRGAGLGLPLARPTVGAPRGEEGDGARRLPRAQESRATSPTSASCPVMPQARQRPAAAAARLLVGVDGRRATACAQIEARRQLATAWSALVLRHLEPLTAAGRSRAAARLRAPPPHRAVVAAAEGAGQRAPADSTATARRSPTRCPGVRHRGCSFQADRLHAGQSRHINRALVSRARCVCWTRRPDERVDRLVLRGLGATSACRWRRSAARVEVLGVEGSGQDAGRARQRGGTHGSERSRRRRATFAARDLFVASCCRRPARRSAQPRSGSSLIRRA